jgi:hypothetical protein
MGNDGNQIHRHQGSLTVGIVGDGNRIAALRRVGGHAEAEGKTRGQKFVIVQHAERADIPEDIRRGPLVDIAGQGETQVARKGGYKCHIIAREENAKRAELRDQAGRVVVHLHQHVEGGIGKAWVALHNACSNGSRRHGSRRR